MAGEAVSGETLDADYWWRNIRAPVRFSDGVLTAIRDHEIGTFLEIGPHPVLRDYVLQAAKTEGAAIVALSTLRRPSEAKPANDIESLDTAIASVFASGAAALEAVFTRPVRAARLPAYAWNRSRFWRGSWELPDAEYATARTHPILGTSKSGADGVWTNTIQGVHLGYLNDHVVQGAPLFPAAGYIEMSLAAGALHYGEAALDLENFEIMRPLVLADGQEPILQTDAGSRGWIDRHPLARRS